MMKDITVLSTPICSRCRLLKKQLDLKNIDYTAVSITKETELVRWLRDHRFVQFPIVAKKNKEGNTEIHQGFQLAKIVASETCDDRVISDHDADELAQLVANQ